MIQQMLFDEQGNPLCQAANARAKPKVTMFRIEELMNHEPQPEQSPNGEDPQKPKWWLYAWTKLKEVIAQAGKSIQDTWAAPVLGLVVYTVLIGGGLIAVFYLIGFLFSAIGFVIGNIFDIAYNYPAILIIMVCVIVAWYYFSAASPDDEKPNEVKPIVEDNTGLFD